VNTDKQILQLNFESVQTLGFVADVDAINNYLNELKDAAQALVDGLKDLFDHYTGSESDKQKLDEYQQEQNRIIDDLLHSDDLTDEEKQELREIRDKANEAYENIRNGVPCGQATSYYYGEDQYLHGPHASSVSASSMDISCYTADCMNGAETASAWTKKVNPKENTTNIDEAKCKCDSKTVVQNYFNSECTAILENLSKIKAALKEKEEVTLQKPMGLYEGHISIADTCIDKIVFDMSFTRNAENTFDPNSYTVQKTYSVLKVPFWAIKYDGILEIKIPDSEEDAEKKIRLVERWLKGEQKNQQEPQDLPYLPWMNFAISEAKAMNGISECYDPLYSKGFEYHREGGHVNFCVCSDDQHTNYCKISAWCASFANWCLRHSNTDYTKSAGSQTFLTNTNFEKISEPVFGAIAVFTKLNKNGTDWYRDRNGNLQGHVTFVIGTSKNKEGKGQILGLGGNQNDKIKVAPYLLSQDKNEMAGKLFFRGYYIPKKYNNKLNNYKIIVVPYDNADTANQQILNLIIKTEENESTR
jgi:uncharacterized protein (TIGR02594 family)